MRYPTSIASGWPRLRTAGWVALLFAVLIGGAPANAATGFAGLPLRSALQRLQRDGLEVFFTSGVVRETMRVESEPRASQPRQVLDELLLPHGLVVQVGPHGTLVVVPDRRLGRLRGRVLLGGSGDPLAGASVIVDGEVAGRSGADGRFVLDALEPGPHRIAAHLAGSAPGRQERVQIVAGQASELTLELVPSMLVAETVTVTSDGRESRHGEPVGALVMSGERVTAAPRLGDDILRAASLLPGTTSADSSARLSVRGGHEDEVAVVLDGLELLAPYHLQEFDQALSIVAPSSVDRIELLAGGFSAEYGDRMTGVLDITSVRPQTAPRVELGFGTLYAEASGAGAFGQRGHWFASGRSGSYRLALEVAGRHENPRYWDVFGKLEHALSDSQSLQLDVLTARDDLSVSAGALEGYRGEWGSGYAWLHHTAVLGRALSGESLGWFGRVERSRRAELGTLVDVDDRRALDFSGLRTFWRYAPGGRLAFDAGAEVQRMEGRIDYLGRSQPPVLALPGTRPWNGERSFAGSFDYDQLATFASGRLRLPDLTVETGLRFERNGLSGEGHLSPRFNAAWQLSGSDVLRGAWGWFHQNQRPYELQVEDGETEIPGAERAEHRVLGYEHRLASGGRWQLEAYERRSPQVRVRYENLFDPLVLFPELAADRFRLAPDESRAAGVELFWASPRRGRVAGWASYAWSTVADRVGDRWVPRDFDQPHALQLGIDLQAPRGWSVDAVWRYHTGWPTTRVRGREVVGPDGSVGIAPELGAVRGGRLPDYHRLDLRLQRDFTLPLGKLTAFLDLQNVYDHENRRGLETVEIGHGPEGLPTLHTEPASWGGFLPSFGVRWRLE